MSALLATAPAATDVRSLARSLCCLAAVLAVHVAVLALLPAGTRSSSAPTAPVTVTLITPPAAPKVMPSTPAPRVVPSTPAVEETKPPEEKRAAVLPKPTMAPPPRQRVQTAPETRPEPRAHAQLADDNPVVPPAVSPAPPATSPSAADTQAPSPGREADPVPDQAGSAPAQKILPPRFDAAYLHNPKPEYPRLARRLGEQGTVLLDVYVGADGSPEKIALNASSGSPRLDRAARETVRQWKFVPARQGERPVGAWIVVPIRFVLEG